MILVDVHCHLDTKDFEDDLDEVIENARKNGVKRIIANGVDDTSNQKVLDIAARYDIVEAALGLYPIDALEREKEESGEELKEEKIDVDVTLKNIEKNKDKIIAIGEIGLDLYNGEDIERQKKIFLRLIEIAKKIDKPIIVHSRKAEKEVLDVLKESGIKPEKVILHCFSGKKALVKEAYEKGYNFTIPTNIVRAENFQIMCKLINISQLLTETDAPWLSPFKGKRNEPGFVGESVKKIAEIKGMDPEEVANNIFMNYRKVFG